MTVAVIISIIINSLNIIMPLIIILVIKKKKKNNTVCLKTGDLLSILIFVLYLKTD